MMHCSENTYLATALWIFGKLSKYQKDMIFINFIFINFIYFIFIHSLEKISYS